MKLIQISCDLSIILSLLLLSSILSKLGFFSHSFSLASKGETCHPGSTFPDRGGLLIEFGDPDLKWVTE